MQTFIHIHTYSDLLSVDNMGTPCMVYYQINIGFNGIYQLKCWQAGRQTGRQAGMQIGRQAGRQASRQAGMQIGKQEGKHGKTGKQEGR